MRCFVAALFDDATRQRLERLLAQASRQPLAVRWVRPEGLHATLAFLGDVSAERAKSVGDVLADGASEQPAIPVQVGSLGGFPSARSARVIWAGVDDPSGRLAGLQASLRMGLARLGFSGDDVAFRAHVTLGRVREGRVSAEQCGARLPASDLSPAPGHVASVVLFRSDLGPGGSTYAPLAAVNLGVTP